MVQCKSVWRTKGIRHIFDEKWNGHQELPVCSWNTFCFKVSSCYCCHSLQIFIWSPYSMRDPFFCTHRIYLFSKSSFYVFCLISTTSGYQCWVSDVEQLTCVPCSVSLVHLCCCACLQCWGRGWPSARFIASPCRTAPSSLPKPRASSSALRRPANLSSSSPCICFTGNPGHFPASTLCWESCKAQGCQSK